MQYLGARMEFPLNFSGLLRALGDLATRTGKTYSILCNRVQLFEDRVDVLSYIFYVTVTSLYSARTASRKGETDRPWSDSMPDQTRTILLASSKFYANLCNYLVHSIV